MFIVALFTIARTQKQPKCSSAEEWVKKMWCVYTMEYYLTIKRNENCATYRDIDGPISTSERKEQIYINTYSGI